MKKILIMMVAGFLLVGAGCQRADQGNSQVTEITLATTTSTYDSGLLDVLLPDFAEKHQIKVNIISVGTGQAMELGQRGDCDIILVHARNLEDKFVEEGYGTERWDVMYNDYVILGPKGDPGNVNGSHDVKTALERIIDHVTEGNSSFVSRGDNSGTHNKEKSLWAAEGLTVEQEEWYSSVGQGMGDTLVVANEMKGFVLSDRGTWLAMQDKLPNLEIVFEGDTSLLNPYGIIPVNPEKHAHIKYAEAMLLVEFMTAPDTQAKIGEFGRDIYGQPLFFPHAK